MKKRKIFLLLAAALTLALCACAPAGEGPRAVGPCADAQRGAKFGCGADRPAGDRGGR